MGVPAALRPGRNHGPYYRSCLCLRLARRSRTGRCVALRSASRVAQDRGASRRRRRHEYAAGACARRARPRLERRRLCRSTATMPSRAGPETGRRRLETGDVDIAAVWGPFAGYEATCAQTPLHVEAIRGTNALCAPAIHLRHLDGRAQGRPALKRRLDEIIDRRSAEIRRLLAKLWRPYRSRQRSIEARHARHPISSAAVALRSSRRRGRRPSPRGQHAPPAPARQAPEQHRRRLQRRNRNHKLPRRRTPRRRRQVSSSIRNRAAISSQTPVSNLFPGPRRCAGR